MIAKELSTSAKENGARNSCRLCMPLGASLAYKGIHRCVPILHGSQGCSTYIRRFLIGHYREPVDIASSSFHESDTIFGGEGQLFQAIRNVERQYTPGYIGIATTCLAETIGEDVPRMLRHFENENGAFSGRLIFSRAPSYESTHVRGFQRTLRAIVGALAHEKVLAHGRPGVVLPMLSPADLRHIAGLVRSFGLNPILLGDYSDTMDGGMEEDPHGMARGGTPGPDLALLSGSPWVLEFGGAPMGESAGALLAKTHGVEQLSMPSPIGLEATDRLVTRLREKTGRPMPRDLFDERQRFLDSLVDGHKLSGGARVAVFGDGDLVRGLGKLLLECGFQVVLAATGEEKGSLDPLARRGLETREDVDFGDIGADLQGRGVDLLLGPSRGYKLSRELGVPLLRCGFPIHDRLGAARCLHVGYRGAQLLYDQIVNTLIAGRQEENPHDYFVY